MQKQFPPLRYVVPGLIPEGLTLLVAPPKAGKSWMVLALAYEIASGGTALGSIPVGTPRPVLYLALEDGERRLQSRLQALGVEAGPERLFFDTKIDPLIGVRNTVQQFMEMHDQEQPVVILDTLGKVKPPAAPGESDYQADYRIAGQLKQLADGTEGAALIVVHHTRKAVSDDFVDSVSGTQGLAGAADTIAMLRRARGEASGSLSITSRDAVEGTYQLLMQGCKWELAGESLDAAATAFEQAKQTENLGDRSKTALEFVNSNPDGVKPYELAKELGITAKDAGSYLIRLENDGRITRLARGLYGPLPRNTHPNSAVGSVGSVGSEEQTTAIPTQTTLPTPDLRQGVLG